MRRLFLMFIAFLLTGVAVASETTSYSLDVDVSPAAQPGFYTCRAVLTDLRDGNVIFAPSIQLKADSTETASGGDGDLASVFKVSIDSATSRVTAEVRVTRAGKIVVEQKSSIAIR
jgi:hypothetical protein